MSSFVYAAARTPFGKFNGSLSGVRPDDLAAHAISSLLARAPGLDPARVDDVVWGNANGAGEENRNVGRMAALLAGLPVSVPGTTVNRLCGSSLDAVHVGSRAIETGDADIVLTGGVESMTRAPWVLPKQARAFPAGDVTAVSTTLGWRLVNPRMNPEWTVSLGEANEQLQQKFGISRERQDEFAARSHRLAHQAWEDGFYDDLVVPLPAPRGAEPLTRDEGIRPGSSAEKLAALQPAFRPDGTITAGNASPLSDGASAVLLGSEAAAEAIGESAAGAHRRPGGIRPRTAGLRLRARRGRQPRAPARGNRLGAGGRRRAQRGVRGPVAGLPRRVEGRPRHRQHPRRRHRHRPPARRLRGAASSGRWPRSSASATSGGASPPSASASARASPSSSRTSRRPDIWVSHVGAQRVLQVALDVPGRERERRARSR